jgi:hypothetical protein
MQVIENLRDGRGQRRPQLAWLIMINEDELARNGLQKSPFAEFL